MKKIYKNHYLYFERLANVPVVDFEHFAVDMVK